jgi:hypothetical protein
MENDTIIVYNRKTIEQMEREGGCGYWTIGADPNSLHSRGIRYVLCIANSRDKHHGQLYFVATLADRHELRPLPMRNDGKLTRTPRRQLLLLREWAQLASAQTWPVKVNFEYCRLDSFGVDVRSLQFTEFKDLRDADEEDQGGQRLHGDTGPRGEGTRSEAIWSAKHSSLCDKLLRELSNYVSVDGSPWRPDILCETQDQRLLLIEVKPDCSAHNIITAMGQLLAYGGELQKVIKILAAPGVHQLKESKPHLHAAIERQGIKQFDLDEDLGPQIQEERFA